MTSRSFTSPGGTSGGRGCSRSGRMGAAGRLALLRARFGQPKAVVNALLMTRSSHSQRCRER
jgi:hypothetical protein